MYKKKKIKNKFEIFKNEVPKSFDQIVNIYHCEAILTLKIDFKSKFSIYDDNKYE